MEKKKNMKESTWGGYRHRWTQRDWHLIKSTSHKTNESIVIVSVRWQVIQESREKRQIWATRDGMYVYWSAAERVERSARYTYSDFMSRLCWKKSMWEKYDLPWFGTSLHTITFGFTVNNFQHQEDLCLSGCKLKCAEFSSTREKTYLINYKSSDE